MTTCLITDIPITVEGYYGVVEKAFLTEEGYHGVCVFNPMGFRNGYVGVDKGHPLYGIDYPGLCDCIRIHGGITFSGVMPWANSEGLWYLGFDCAHLDDTPDLVHHEKYLAQFEDFSGEVLSVPYEKASVKPLAYVEKEVIKLSSQMTAESLMENKMSNN